MTETGVQIKVCDVKGVCVGVVLKRLKKDKSVNFYRPAVNLEKLNLHIFVAAYLV